jgi:ABC-type transport system involved in Fe-S cluster assembly fused permease/ATPase subunit
MKLTLLVGLVVVVLIGVIVFSLMTIIISKSRGRHSSRLDRLEARINALEMDKDRY